MTRTYRVVYTMTPWATVAYLGLVLVIGLIAIASANPEARVLNIEAWLPGFYTHTSNLMLSLALVLIYGLLRLLYDAGLGEIAIFVLLVVASNYAYELFLTLYNTKDVIDAHCGAVAALIGLGLIALIKHHGLRPPPSGKTDQVSNEV